LAYKERTVYLKKVKSLRDYLWKRIKTEIKDVHLNGSMKNRVPANLNICFLQLKGKLYLMDMSYKGVYVSTGSACSASNLHSSYVLKAIGFK
jgi:cysteine desulfurase